MPTFKYRYYGARHLATSHGGIITCAVRATGLNNSQGHPEYVVGIAVTPKNMKYDAKACRAIAEYRAEQVAEKSGSSFNKEYKEILDVSLICRATHFCKVDKVGIGIYSRYVKNYRHFTSEDFPYATGYCLIVYAGNTNKAKNIDEAIKSHLISMGYGNIVDA